MKSSAGSDGAGAARWLTIHDELLRGLTHALSNRVATISAASTLLSLGGASAERAPAMLQAETERLEQLLQLMRQLPHRADAHPEPILAVDAAQSAIGLFAHHPEARDVACEIVTVGDVLPAWADPGALQLALVTALVRAHVHASVGNRIVRVTLGSDTDTATFTVTARANDDGSTRSADADGEVDADCAAAAWLLHDSHGHASVHGGGLQLTVRTLAAARRAR